MAIDNRISIAFSNDEMARVDSALATLEEVFAGKVIQLTAEESKKYGKLGLNTENWVNMVYADCQASPLKLAPEFVDKNEWTKDELARDQLSPRVSRLETIAQQIVDTNRLIGFDIHQTCRSVYNNVKFLANENVPGTKVYFDKWKEQFAGQGVTKKPDATDEKQKPL